MATAETARLIASLELKDNLSKGVNSATASIGKLEGKMNRLGGIAQKGVSNALTNITRLGLGAGVAIAGAVGLGIRSLADLARTEGQTEAVIRSTGSAAGQTAAEVRALSESLENLSTVDDKVIQDGQNMLLTFTNIGEDVFPQATKAMLNLGVAMAGGNVEQVDLKASAIQLGKALNDPIKGVTALRKVGVSFTKAQQDQIKALVETGDVLGAQTVILKELEKEFGNAAEAAGKGPQASWRRLQDVGEDLSQTIARGLLPVLVRASDWLSNKLADPAVVKTIDDIGQALGRAGSEALDFIETVDFKGIADSLGVAVGFAGGIVKAFAGMPDWIKTAVVTGWGLNKLTGGAVVDLGKLVVEQFAARGATPANPLFVSDVTGGLGKGLIPGAAGAAGAGVGGAALAGGGLLVASAAISAAAIMASPQFNRSLQLKGQASNLNAAEIAAIKYYQGDAAYQRQVVLHLGKAPTKQDFESGLAKLRQGTEVFGPPTPANLRNGDAGGRNLRSTFDESAIIARALAKGFKPTDAAVQATLQRNMIREQEKTKAAIDAVKAQEGRTTAAALLTAAAVQNIDRKQPVTNVTTVVNVTAAQVKRAVVIQRRYGPSGGSRHRGGPQEFD
jgi:hypothetical protein